MVSYEDLDLRIRSDGNQFVVHAQRGSQQATERLELDLALCKGLRVLEGLEPERVRRQGETLFKALIHARVRDLYHQGRGYAGRDADAGLRIRLLFDPSDRRLRPLIDLPWELLREPGDANNLPALDSRRPIVRVIDATEPSLRPSPGKLERVLLVLASPEDDDPLDLQRELDAVKQTLARLAIRPVVVKHATRDALYDAIADGKPQIVHFMGHSDVDPDSGEGVLLLESPAQGEDRLTGSELARFFVDGAAPRLVILNSCLSGAQGHAEEPFAGIAFALAATGLPAVIAMQSEVLDESAIRFTERLYRHLASDHTIEAAVADARRALSISRLGTLDWAAPVLFTRHTPVAAATPEQSEQDTPSNQENTFPSFHWTTGTIGTQINNIHMTRQKPNDDGK